VKKKGFSFKIISPETNKNPFKIMIQKTILPFQLLEEKNDTNLTSFGGLLPWLELAKSCGLLKLIHKNLNIQKSNCLWSDASILFSIILLNLAGGESVEDIDRFEFDGGLAKFFRRFIPDSLSRDDRKSFERKAIKNHKRAFPSKTKIFNWLSSFHDEGEMKKRVENTAFIPKSNEALQFLSELNKGLCDFAFKKLPSSKVTLDIDATLIETNHKSAKFCYKSFRAYQPLNVWWAEKKMMLHSEFRDGNVNAGFDILRIFKESIDLLPSGIEEVNLRSDSAAYDWKLMRWCEKKEEFHPELKIGFVIGASVCQSMRDEIAKIEPDSWVDFNEKTEEKTEIMKKLGRIRKWAELPFIPSVTGKFSKKENYRYLVLREAIQTELIEGEGENPDLPFPNLKIGRQRYKVSVIVTNKNDNGEDLIHWYFKRAGDSEHAHSILKSDLAGGRMPSDKFGVNAAWWQISLISMNLLSIMQKFVWKGEPI
jgi:hypothetical protein